MRLISRTSRVLFLLSLLTALAASTAMAELKLPSIVADHMVLQQSRPVPIWGWAQPGEEVTVAIAGQTVKGKADDKGRWQVEIGPLQAGGPLEIVISDAAGNPRRQGPVGFHGCRRGPEIPSGRSENRRRHHRRGEQGS